MRPANTRRLTSAKVSSLRWNSSSNSAPLWLAGFTSGLGLAPPAQRGSASSVFFRASNIVMRASGASALGRALRQELQDLLEDLVRLDTLGLALEVEQHAMAQGRQRRGLHVLERDGEATLEQRADLRRQEHGLRAARRGAGAHVALDRRRRVARLGP